MGGLRIQVPIAARPIRAAEPGIGEPHPRAQHDDARGDQRAQSREASKPEQPLFFVHVLADVGQAQQSLHIFEHAFGLGVRSI